jgi:hypothetical protein
VAEERPSEAALYVAVGRAGRCERKVVSAVSPVDEAWFYAMGAVISAVSGDQDPGEGSPRRD